MSWLDSSFSFAKTALSQAQKSIDRVLDIKEHSEDGKNEPARPAAASSKPTSTTTNADDSSPSGSDPSSTSSLSSWFQPKQAGTKHQSSATTPSSQTQQSSDSFTSTWGTGDSFWSSTFGSPAKKEPSKSPAVSSLKKPPPTSADPTPPRGSGSRSTKSTARGLAKNSKSTPSSVARGGSDRQAASTDSTAGTPHSRIDQLKKGSPPMKIDSPTLTSTPVNAKEVKPPSQKKGESEKRQTAKLTAAEDAEDTKKLPSHGSRATKDGTRSHQSKGTAQDFGRDAEAAESSDKPTLKSEHISPQQTPQGISVAAVLETDSADTIDGRDGTQSSMAGPPSPSHSTSLAKEAQKKLVGEAYVPVSSSSGSDLTSHGSSHTQGEPREHVQVEGALDYVTHAVMHSATGRLTPSDSENVNPREAKKDLKEKAFVAGAERSSKSRMSPGTKPLPDHASKAALQREGTPEPPKHGESSQEIPSGAVNHDPKNVPPDLVEDVPMPASQSPKDNSENVAVAPISPTPPLTTTIAVAATRQQSDGSLGGQTQELPDEGDRPVVESKAHPQETVQAESLQQGGAELERGGGREKEESEKLRTVEDASGSGESSAPAAAGGDLVRSTGEEVQRLREELQQVRKVLEVRESKLLEMSRDSIQLREENQQLETQLSECRDLLQSGQTDVEELRAECTRRISTSEKKLQTVIKERDSLRKQLQALQNEQSQQKRSAEQELTELLREKEEQIAGLMREGENLSKQQLQSHNTIKKMRAKDKQNDQLLAAQRQQIEDCEREIKRLKEVLEKKGENEKKYQESLAQLNNIAEQQEKELLTLKSERDDLTDKVRSLQTNLDNTFKELSEVRKASAVTQSVAQEAALSAEQMAREELMSVLEQSKMEAQREKESLLMQVNELRMSVSRTEQQAAWREEHMRQEVADIQQRLQDAEARNQELTSSISDTTKPLLRQIDNLQVAHSTQAANWERVETSLTQRLVEAQTQLNLAVEKERSASEKEVTLQSRVAALENQLAALRQERAQLLASLELERAKLETLEEGQQRDSAKLEALRTSYQQSLEDLKKEKEMLERQLEYERVRLEAESRKACLESQEKERLRSKLANSISSLSRTISRQSSSSSVQSQSEILEKSLVADGSSSSGLMEGISHSRFPSASASVIEHLQSQLKQKEGELANTQNLVSSLERSRAAVAEDLASLSAQNEALTTQVETIPVLQQKLQEVQRNYEALLQMYGEKAELTEELKMDIEDLKTMYRQQIDELLSGRS